MQALILAGGEGTRLRPLTSTVPKPVVPLVDRPHMAYMIDWLRGHGVDDVVLACGFMASGVRNVLGDGSALGVRLRYVEEPQALGTGGAAKFAEPLLDERFLMLNGDVLTDLDLSAQIAQHERTGARATLALIGVDDPSRYGLVRLDDDDAVTAFLEKPSPDQIDTNLISAGAYVLERDVLDLLTPGEPASIERNVFPRLVGGGAYGYRASGYWLDIGTPATYLQATFDVLEGNVASAVRDQLSDGLTLVYDGARVDGRVIGPAVVQRGALVADGARVGSLAVIGPDVSIAEGAVVERAVVLEGAEIGPGAVVRDSIVAAGVVIGARTHVEEGAVLGEGATIGAGNFLRAGVRIFPGVTLPDEAIRFP